MGAVTNKKMKVIFDEEKLEVQNCSLIATGVKTENQCYEMFFKCISSKQANSASLESVKLWHEKLGHLHFQGLKYMIENNSIPNLDMKHTMICIVKLVNTVRLVESRSNQIYIQDPVLQVKLSIQI